MAFDEAEAFDLKGIGAKINVFGQKRLQTAASLQMCQFDVWNIGPGIGGQPDLLEAVLYPVLQGYQRRVLLDTDPRSMSAEMTHTGERQHKRGCLDAQQGVSDIGRRRIVDCTDKAQRKMELAGPDPLGARYPRTKLREIEFELLREVDANEEARHGRLNGGGIAASWPAAVPEPPPLFAGM